MNRENELVAQIADLEKQVIDLKRKLDFLGSAVDHMPNPVFMKGPDGRFVFFNRQYAEKFGMSKEKYIGKTVLNLEYLPEEDREKYQKEDLELIRTGKSYSYNKEFTFSDGIGHPAFYWSKGFVCSETGEHGLVGEIVDITEEREVKNSMEEIVKGAAYMFDRFFVVDLEKGIFTNFIKNDEVYNRIYMSQSYSEFYEKAKGRFFHAVNQESVDWYFSIEGLRELLKDKNDFYFECKSIKSEQKIYGTTVYCIERKENIPTRVIYAIRDITEAKAVEHQYQKKLKEANDKLKDLANRDGLTGLYNRRGLMEAIRLQLNEDCKVALLLIDVDHFKAVNDSHGHFSGDKLLEKVAELLKTSFRTTDILSRLGGDEFMAILIGCDYECGTFIPAKIAEINRKLQETDGDIPIGSISVGIAFSKKGETQNLYNRADAALYKTKARGRCGCCIYEDEFEEVG